MNADQQDFEALKRLLKLKRYEKPPPRYFNDFSGQVLNRIRNSAPTAKDEDYEAVRSGWQWLDRVLAAFQQKPALAGVFGAAICGLLVLGVAYSEKLDAARADDGLSAIQPNPSPVPQSITAFSGGPALLGNSTNPFTPVSSSLFDVNVSPIPVTWKPGGN